MDILEEDIAASASDEQLLTIEEAFDILGISVPTAHRDWAYAKAWLHQEIRENESTPDHLRAI